MSYPDFLTQKETILVTKRYKITDEQDKRLLEIEEKLNIPPSSIVRLALDCFLPKTENSKFKYEGIERLWNDKKF